MGLALKDILPLLLFFLFSCKGVFRLSDRCDPCRKAFFILRKAIARAVFLFACGFLLCLQVIGERRFACFSHAKNGKKGDFSALRSQNANKYSQISVYRASVGLIFSFGASFVFGESDLVSSRFSITVRARSAE